MRGKSSWAMMALAVAVLSGISPYGTAAHASDDTRSAQTTYDTAEDCMSDQTFGDMTGCVSTGDGWAKMEEPFGRNPLGAFMIFALLWAAIPTVASGMVAASRQQSVGIAVLLGLVLGWIGLLIVVLVMKPEVTRAARTFIEREGAPQAAYPRSPQRTAVDRLAELTELKERGLVTAEEYETRRSAIIREV